MTFTPTSCSCSKIKGKIFKCQPLINQFGPRRTNRGREGRHSMGQHLPIKLLAKVGLVPVHKTLTTTGHKFLHELFVGTGSPI